MNEPGTDIEQPGTTDVVSQADIDAAATAAAAIQAATPQDRPTLPVVKLCQQLSKEVESGNAKSGEYVNTLTGRNYGETFSLVVAYPTIKGRFFGPKGESDSYAALGDVAPNSWPEQYRGLRFEDIPDAEEIYRVEHADDWGDGPPISTTLNFIGFSPDEPTIPVRLSLMRTSAPAGRKIDNILRWAFKSPWSNVVELSSVRKTNAEDKPYYVVNAVQGRETTPEEQGQAVKLFQIVQDNVQGLQLVGDGADPKPAAAPPADTGGLAVS